MARFTASRTPNSPPFAGARRRHGCLGCLFQTLLILAAGCVLIMAITAVFAPWGYFMGGSFHIIPYWQGWGTLHAKSGRYVVYVSFEPSPHRSHILPGSALQGRGYLCTPRGEVFRLTLGGGMRRGLNLNTDNEKISLYMYHRPIFSFTTDRRPGIELRGQWHNPNLVMDDHSSIQRAFNADATVYHGGGPERPYMGEIVPVTLVPGSYSDFKAACQAPH